MSLVITSDSFGEGDIVPSKHTCEGANVSPPLTWSGVPSGAKSLVLIVDDPDAPDPRAPKMTWVHWVLYNLPPSATGLREAVKRTQLPAGTLETLNDFRRPGWGGPCPPVGRHRYYFRLHALDAVLPDLGGQATRAQLDRAMNGHVLARAALMGTYQKGDR